MNPHSLDTTQTLLGRGKPEFAGKSGEATRGGPGRTNETRGVESPITGKRETKSGSTGFIANLSRPATETVVTTMVVMMMMMMMMRGGVHILYRRGEG
jgi:hypothetical protein